MTSRFIFLAALTLLSPYRSADNAAPAAPSATRNPFAQHALAAADRRWLHGEVKERLSAGHYLYLRVEEPSGSSAWLVSLAATTPNSSQVSALVLGRAAHFHSKRLARDFDPLLFAAVRRATP